MVRCIWLPALCWGLLSLLCFSCAEPALSIQAVEIRNMGQTVIQQVHILQDPTGKVGEVSLVLPQDTFVLRFSRRPLLAQSSRIQWVDKRGRTWQRRLPLPAGSIVPGAGVVLVYRIYETGQATVAVEPNH